MNIYSLETQELKPYKREDTPSQHNDLHNVLKNVHHKELPIDRYREVILKQVEKSDEVIISAETGAGKSTRVPQFLAEAGYNVIITQPRRLAATSLAQHVAKEMKTELWEEVGYHIGWNTGEHKKISDKTRIKYCTDGLHLVQQLVATPSEAKDTVLIIDEIHERNQNVEILLAWLKKEKQQGKKIKVILMSATLDQQALEEFFSFSWEKQATIEVPGRLYPVEYESCAERQLLSKVIELQEAQRNILVFQPWKKEIEETIAALRMKLWSSVIILPLHGELSVEEQARVFKKYDQPVIIVSTNIAQTSVTIPYIDAVVDSAKEKRIELKDGVETLALGDISQADVKQRAGRAGRCKPGVYVYCNDTPQHTLPQFSQAEIERTRLDLNYLRILAKTGYGMEELDFFHQPPQENILHAKKKLRLLGAIDEKNQVTKLGKNLSKLPIDVNEGVMILKALELGVLDEVLKIAAIKTQKGIISHKDQEKVPRECRNQDSDLLTNLKLFEMARELKDTVDENGKKIPKSELLKGIWINHKSYFRALESYLHLKTIFRAQVYRNTSNTLTEEAKNRAIQECIIAGMIDNIWIKDRYWDYQQEKWGEERELSRSSFIWSPKIIAADPMNIQFTNRYGHISEIQILSSATKAEEEILRELAPQNFSTETHDPEWSSSEQKVLYQLDHLFNGLVFKEEDIEAEVNKESIRIFAKALASRDVDFQSEEIQELCEHNRRILREMEALKVRFFGSIPKFGTAELAEYLYEILHNKNIISIKDLKEALEKDRKGLLEALKLNEASLLIKDYNKKIKSYPETLQFGAKEYPVHYKETRSSYKIQIAITPEDIPLLKNDSFQSYFEGNPYVYLLESENGKEEIDDLIAYKQRLEQKRLDEKWADFDQTFNRLEEIKSFEEWDGERTPSSKCYDSETGSLAYQGLVKQYWEDAFFPKRFRTQEEACILTEATKKAFLEYQEEKKKKADYLNHLNALKTRYDELLKHLNSLEGREEHEGAERITKHLQQFTSFYENHNFDDQTLKGLESYLNEIENEIENINAESSNASRPINEDDFQKLGEKFWTNFIRKRRK